MAPRPSATAINVTTPAHSASTGDVIVVGPGGSSATSAADRYTYVTPAPVVTGLSAQSGPAIGGTPLVITGSNLGGAVAVSFGGIAVTGFSVNSAGTSISVVTPADIAGVADVRVTTTGGTSAISMADQFNFVGLPTITALDVLQGPASGGTTVKLTGANLNLASAVFFGAVAAQSFVINQDGTISAVAPGVASSVPLVTDVRVVTPSGTSTTGSADQFTYFPPPTVTSLSRSSGPTAGGQIVVSGSNLSAATQVYVGSVASSFLANADGTLTVTLPASAAGTADLTVLTPWGTSTTGVADQYSFVPPPIITALDTSAGSTTGGGTITISGSALSGALAVYVGTVSTAFTVNSNGTVSAQIPPEAAGSADVTIVTAGGVSALGAADQYSFVPAPVITGLDTSSGTNSGGAVVTISGSGLSGASALYFGSISVPFTINPNGTISTLTPVGLLGTVDITVVTVGGQSAASSADLMTFVINTSAGDAALATSDQAAETTATQADNTAATHEGTDDQTALDALQAASNTALANEAANDQTASDNFSSAAQGANDTAQSSDQTAGDAADTADQAETDGEESSDQSAVDAFNSGEATDASTENSSDQTAQTTLNDAGQAAMNTEQSTDATASQTLADATASAQQQYNTSAAAAQDAYNTAIASGTEIMGTFDPTTGTVIPLPPYDPSQDPAYQSATQAADVAYGTAVANAQSQYQSDLQAAAAIYLTTAAPAIATYNQSVADDLAEEQTAASDAASQDTATQATDAATDATSVQNDEQTLEDGLASDEATCDSAASAAQATYTATIAADKATFDGTKRTADAQLAQDQSNDQTAYNTDMATAQATFQDSMTRAKSAYDTVANDPTSTPSAIGQAAAAGLVAEANAQAALLTSQTTAQTNRNTLDAAAADTWAHTVDGAMEKQTEDDARAADTLVHALDAAAAKQMQQDAQASANKTQSDTAAAADQARQDAAAALAEILADDAAVVIETGKDATAADQEALVIDPAYSAMIQAAAQAKDTLNTSTAQAQAAKADAYAAALASGTAAWAAGQPGNPAATLQAAMASANATQVTAVDAAQVAYATATGTADANWYTDVGPAVTAYLNGRAADVQAFQTASASDAQTLLNTVAKDMLTTVTTTITQTQNLANSLLTDGMTWIASIAGQQQKLADKVADDSTAAIIVVAPQTQKCLDTFADTIQKKITADAPTAMALAGSLGSNLVTWATSVGGLLQSAGAASPGIGAGTSFDTTSPTIGQFFRAFLDQVSTNPENPNVVGATIGGFGKGLVDTFMDGRAFDSFQGCVTKMEEFGSFSFITPSQTSPMFGHNGAYADGVTVGGWSNMAMSLVATYGGANALVRGSMALFAGEIGFGGGMAAAAVNGGNWFWGLGGVLTASPALAQAGAGALVLGWGSWGFASNFNFVFGTPGAGGIPSTPGQPAGYTRMQDYIPFLEDSATPATTQLTPQQAFALKENLEAIANRTVVAVRANIQGGRSIADATQGLQGQLNLLRFRFIDQVPGGRAAIDAILQEFPNLTFPN